MYVSFWDPDTKPLNTEQFTGMSLQSPQVFYPGLAANSVPHSATSPSLFPGGKPSMLIPAA